MDHGTEQLKIQFENGQTTAPFFIHLYYALTWQVASCWSCCVSDTSTVTDSFSTAVWLSIHACRSAHELSNLCHFTKMPSSSFSFLISRVETEPNCCESDVISLVSRCEEDGSLFWAQSVASSVTSSILPLISFMSSRRDLKAKHQSDVLILDYRLLPVLVNFRLSTCWFLLPNHRRARAHERSESCQAIMAWSVA